MRPPGQAAELFNVKTDGDLNITVLYKVNTSWRKQLSPELFLS
jgi:hypothetical protein